MIACVSASTNQNSPKKCSTWNAYTHIHTKELLFIAIWPKTIFSPNDNNSNSSSGGGGGGNDDSNNKGEDIKRARTHLHRNNNNKKKSKEISKMPKQNNIQIKMFNLVNNKEIEFQTKMEQKATKMMTAAAATATTTTKCIQQVTDNVR